MVTSKIISKMQKQKYIIPSFIRGDNGFIKCELIVVAVREKCHYFKGVIALKSIFICQYILQYYPF